MISITADPQNPDKLIVTQTVTLFLDKVLLETQTVTLFLDKVLLETQTVTLFLDKVLLETLSDELVRVIREQAAKDFNKTSVRRELSRLSTSFLAKQLGVNDVKA